MPTSAYPQAFPGALASWAILPPPGVRLTPAPDVVRPESPSEVTSFLIPVVCWVKGLAIRRVTLWMRVGVAVKTPPFTVPVLDRAHNSRRLVALDGDSDASSCSYPYPAVLGGIPGRVPGNRRSGPLQGLVVSRDPGASASPPHQEGRASHPHRNEVVTVPKHGAADPRLLTQPFPANESHPGREPGVPRSCGACRVRVRER